MYAYKVAGQNVLKGSVEIQGAKNAVLPVMAAALLTSEPMELTNISYLTDVKVLSDLLKSLGMKIEALPNKIRLKADSISSRHADYEFVSKMRGSFWVLGPLLSRFHQAEVSLPGGCAIGTRPVDLYLVALGEMGAEINVENGYVKARGKLHGAEIFFPRVSVGATHNTVMSAVLAEGTTVIHNPALEPEVIDLLHVLVKMGAKIEGIGSKVLTIHGVEKLHGCAHEIVPDRIETATFAAAAALTHGQILMKKTNINLLNAVADVLRVSGVVFEQQDRDLWVDASQAVLTATPVTTCEYPGFPTDAQALLTSVLALSKGESLVEERIFENRFMHIPELQRMGAKVKILTNQSVLITGVDFLSGTTVMSSDLRGGVGLVLAALAAKGETIIKRIYHIERGYFHLEEKLKSLGADIERIHLDD